MHNSETCLQFVTERPNSACLFVSLPVRTLGVYGIFVACPRVYSLKESVYTSVSYFQTPTVSRHILRYFVKIKCRKLT